MRVGDKVSYDAVNEAYCLIGSYLREDGKIVANYDRDRLTHFVQFLSEILKHPENFTNTDQSGSV
jgi:hypothetical protein